MERASLWAVATIGLLAATGCASSTEDPATGSQAATRQAPRCFSARNVSNIRVQDARTAHARVGRDVYRIDLLGSCPDLTFTSRARLVSTGNSMICAGAGLGTSLVTRGGGPQRRCSIQSITALTPEQVEALPSRARP